MQHARATVEELLEAVFSGDLRRGCIGRRLFGELIGQLEAM
jgi:hypothetical protein